MLVAQSCPALCDLMDCSPPVSSVHGILQVRIPECVAIPFSRGSSQLRDWTQVSHIAGRFFTIWASREALLKLYIYGNVVSRNGELLLLEVFQSTGEDLVCCLKKWWVVITRGISTNWWGLSGVTVTRTLASYGQLVSCGWRGRFNSGSWL